MKKVVVWGTGKKAIELSSVLQNSKIVAYVETSPRIKYFNNVKVIKAENIKEISFDILIVTPIESCDIKINIEKNKLVDKKQIVFLYISGFADWKNWCTNFIILEGLVPKQWLYEVLKEQGIENRLYDPVLIENCYFSKREDNILKSIKKYGRIQFINGLWTEKYYNLKSAFHIESRTRKWYAKYKGKKIYFPSNWTYKESLFYWRETLIKNDPKSPTYSKYRLKKSDKVVLLIGDDIILYACRALDKAEAIFIVETECERYMYLKEIFAKDLKVQIYSSYDQIKDLDIDWARIDIKDNVPIIENILRRNQVENIEVTTYYEQDNFIHIRELLYSKGYEISESTGLVYYPDIEDVYRGISFRRALITARKN